MFSNVIEPNVPYTQMQVFGITREEPQSEIPLRNFSYIQPFTDDLLTASFLRLAAEPRYEEDRRQVLNEALLDCLERYESMRRAGRHDGPQLKAIRLYVAPQWRPDGQGENVDESDDRLLIARVRQP